MAADLDEDIWGNDNEEDNKAPDENDDAKTNPFSNKYSNNNNDEDDVFDNNNTPNQSNGNSSYQQPSNIDHGNNDDPAKNNLLSYYDVGLDGDSEIRLINTEERKGRVTKYTVYIIESSVFGQSTTSVARRYNDFKW
eukprot:CAMPEP_0201596172 /NCGR_PEP_ID=MMETSP0190_2-20130828/192940_1 /ASSEMBLY_ACC=CAM_ASM_000263 /TAXON_ID=37353 /ORGANISM="Rosalina sp." /LENGTH=136 /DNA_ID=CAMNT_0048056423 /DNA_START=16 /DNA_END=423 /DNA_ORIENTATION=+